MSKVIGITVGTPIKPEKIGDISTVLEEARQSMESAKEAAEEASRYSGTAHAHMAAAYGEAERAKSYAEQGAEVAASMGKATTEAINAEKNRAIARENEIEELFSKPTQEAVNNWLDSRPEATTTVQDHSLTIDKMVIGTLGYITPRMFGAKGDGVTDDTDAIRSAVSAMTDGSTLVFESGTYLVSLRSGYTIKIKNLKNISIIGHGNPIIQLQGNAEHSYEVIKLESCTDFKIEGLTVCGDRFTHDYTDGRSHGLGYGIALGSSNGVLCSGKVIDCNISNFTGDGVFIGNVSAVNCTAVNVTVKGCEIHHCRRQGISVLDSESAVIDNCYIHHIGTHDGITGVPPMAGIDSEPGLIHAYSIRILNTKIEETTHYNVVCGDYLQSDGMNYVVDIEMANCEFHGPISIKPTNPINIRNCSFYGAENPTSVAGQVGVIAQTGRSRFTRCTFEVPNLYMTYDEDNEIVDCVFRSNGDDTIYRSDTYNSYLEGITIQQSNNRQYFNNFYKNCKIHTFGSFNFVFRNCTFVNLTKHTQFAGNENKIKFYGCVFDTRPFENAIYVNCTILDEAT